MYKIRIYMYVNEWNTLRGKETEKRLNVFMFLSYVSLIMITRSSLFWQDGTISNTILVEIVAEVTWTPEKWCAYKGPAMHR